MTDYFECTKCVQNLWVMYPVVLAVISFMILACFAFGAYLKPWADAISLALRKHELLVALLGEQVTRLMLLKRLTIPFPQVFSGALGYYAVFFGLNTFGVGIQCAKLSSSWSFSNSFWITVSGSVGLCVLFLLLDFHNRMRGLVIPVPQWHVFDAMDFALPMSHQAAWQALATKPIGKETVLKIDPNINFNDPAYNGVICAAIFVIVFSLGFTVIRYWLARCVPCRAMVSDNTNPRQRSGRFLAETTPRGQVMRRRDDGLKILQIGSEEFHEFAMFQACRALLNIERTLSIIVSSLEQDPVSQSAFLLGVSALEFLLVWRVPSARAFIVRSGHQSLSAALFCLFLITNSVGFGCRYVGDAENSVGRKCGSNSASAAIGGLLIVANVALFYFIVCPILFAIKKNLSELHSRPLASVYAYDKEVDPVHGVTDSSSDAKFVLISFGKPVVSSTLPRARPQPAAATRPRPRELAGAITRSPRLAPLPIPKFSSSSSLDESSGTAPSSAPNPLQLRAQAPPNAPTALPVDTPSWSRPLTASMRRLISAISTSQTVARRSPVPVPKFSSTSDRSLTAPASAEAPRASDFVAQGNSALNSAGSSFVFRTPSGEDGGLSRANSIRLNPLPDHAPHAFDELGRPLADGWTRVTDANDGAVFFTHASEPSRWEPPLRDSFVPGDRDDRGRPLAPGWTRACDVSDGAVYYVHAVEASRWDPPLRE